MGKLPVLLFFVCCWIIHPLLMAQDESSIKAILSEGDIKKLEKADSYKKQADLLTEEASKLNMEVFTVQSDMTLEDKAREKRMKQLESKAMQDQIEAAALYEKCNEIKYTVYKQYIDAFWKTHENQEADYLNAKLLEEQSTDHFYQAISYRIEAKKMNGYAKVARLTEAHTLEIQAIQKQITALGEYHGMATPAAVLSETPEHPGSEPISETTGDVSETVTEQANEPVSEPAADAYTAPDSENVSQLPVNEISTELPSKSEQQGDIVINQQMIDSYNRYISTGQFNDTTLSTGALAGVSSFDAANILNLWYEYVYGRGSDYAEISRETADVEDEPGIASDNKGPVIIDKTTASQDDKEIGIVTDENVGKLIPADENVVYRVQIAANKTELTQRALSKMYYGNKNVEMINENGWFKYSVGDFETYEEASRFRKSSGISNAFVVAYRKGTRFKSGSNDTLVQVQNAMPVIAENRLPGGLIFRIQVAASRVPLTVAQLGRIYSGSYPVEMIFEDGWYKYQLMGVRLYADAQLILKNIQTSGVFMVAYEDGVKTDLASAYEKSKSLEKELKIKGRDLIPEETEFHVQLAASRTAMTSAEMALLFTEPEKISVIFEDGWYKYHIKTGNSADEAERVKTTCGIAGAFIVAYNKAAKLNYYEAKRKSGNH